MFNYQLLVGLSHSCDQFLESSSPYLCSEGVTQLTQAMQVVRLDICRKEDRLVLRTKAYRINMIPSVSVDHERK